MTRRASSLLLTSAALWLIFSCFNLLDPFMDDFNSLFDYVTELSFGLAFLPLALGVGALVHAHKEGERPLGKVATAGRWLLMLGGAIMPLKSIAWSLVAATVGVASGATAPILPFFTIAALSSFLGLILSASGIIKAGALPRWGGVALLLSLPLALAPIGSFVSVLLLLGASLAARQGLAVQTRTI